MKKNLFISSLLLILFSTLVHAQNKKVAVVTFFINKKIDVTEFGASAFVAVNKLISDPAFDMGPLLKTYHSIFFDNYVKNFSFDIIPEEQVLNNEAYKAYQPVGIDTSGILKASNYITTIDGYKILLPLAGHKNEKNMVQIFGQADGVMDVSIDFKLIKIGFGGMGVVKVLATANITLINKNGDKVFIVSENAKSKTISPLVAGVPVMTTEKIMPMCESAGNELLNELQNDLPKLIKKTEARL